MLGFVYLKRHITVPLVAKDVKRFSALSRVLAFFFHFWYLNFRTTSLPPSCSMHCNQVSDVELSDCQLSVCIRQFPESEQPWLRHGVDTNCTVARTVCQSQRTSICLSTIIAIFFKLFLFIISSSFLRISYLSLYYSN